MKRFIYLIQIFLLFSAVSVFAQPANNKYNDVIMPRDVDPKILNAMGLSPYEEKLVRLAWENYPSSEIYTSKVRIAEKNISLEKFSWTDDIKASFNFNQRNIEAGLGTTDANNF